MSSDAHMVIKKVKGKYILEIGWSKADVEAMYGNYCLTKPWSSGSFTFSHSHGWTIFNLKTKDQIADFEKAKDAKEYFNWIINKRQ